MLDGSYFGDLKNYVDRNFFDTYRDMYIYLPERQLHYQIIAEVVYGDMLISDSHDLKIPESVITFVDELKGIQEAQNQYAEDMTVTSQDRLVALSTCIGDRPSNRRLVVAKLVDEKLIEAQPAENAGNTAPEENTNTPENPPA
jgi:sortase B